MTQDLWLAKLVCFTKQNIVACLKVHEAVCCLLNARVWCFFWRCTLFLACLSAFDEGVRALTA